MTMSIDDLDHDRPPGGHPRATPEDDDAPDRRGRLSIADRVVEKIAAQAASEVDGATGSPRRVLGLSVSNDPGVPQVSARVDGDVATVSIHLAVTWPMPIPDVTRQVRRQVIDKLGELVGITRTQVDIEVTALPTGPPQPS